MGLMRQAFTTFTVGTQGRGFTEITEDVAHWVASSEITDGLLTLLLRHTSASLLIQENAASEVRTDIAAWLERLAPENADYAHDDEGADDMPAHLRAVLTGVQLSIPVAAGRMRLGTWQGIYLAEHRRSPHRREVAAHLIGE